MPVLAPPPPAKLSTTSSIVDFAAYVKAHSEDGAAVFVDADKMRATAILNLGTPDLPGHADNVAHLQARKTAAMQALDRITMDGGQPQLKVVEFLEDWGRSLTCIGEDGSNLTLQKVISAFRTVTIEALRRAQTEQTSLSAARTTLERVTATGAETIPARIAFTLEPYSGLPTREFHLRVGILTTADKPTIVLRIVNKETHEEAMAHDLATAVSREIGDAMSVMVGAYTRKD